MSPQMMMGRMGRMALSAIATARNPKDPLARATAVSPWMESGMERIKCPVDAPALPFVPFAFKGTHELQSMLAHGRACRNRPRHRPPLALALFGLLATSSAMVATAPATESALTAAVPVIRRSVSDIESALVEAAARTHGLQQLSFNDAVEH
jgi:hypothetical protein